MEKAERDGRADGNPSGSDRGDDVPRDLYGFAMRGLTAEDAAARAACDARQAHLAREWARGWLGRPERVWRSIGTLKRHIRCVRPHCLPYGVDADAVEAMGVWACETMYTRAMPPSSAFTWLHSLVCDKTAKP
jgi:hypothetical protein